MHWRAKFGSLNHFNEADYTNVSKISRQFIEDELCICVSKTRRELKPRKEKNKNVKRKKERKRGQTSTLQMTETHSLLKRKTSPSLYPVSAFERIDIPLATVFFSFFLSFFFFQPVFSCILFLPHLKFLAWMDRSLVWEIGNHKKVLFLVFLLCEFPSWLKLLFSVFFFLDFMKYSCR